MYNINYMLYNINYMQSTISDFNLELSNYGDSYTITLDVGREHFVSEGKDDDRCTDKEIDLTVQHIVNNSTVFTQLPISHQEESGASNTTYREATVYANFADDTRSYRPNMSKVFSLVNPKPLHLARSTQLRLANLLTSNPNLEQSDERIIYPLFQDSEGNINVIRLLRVEEYTAVVQMQVSKYDSDSQPGILNVAKLELMDSDFDDLDDPDACDECRNQYGIVNSTGIRLLQKIQSHIPTLVTCGVGYPDIFSGNNYLEYAFLFLIMSSLQGNYDVTGYYLDDLFNFAENFFQYMFLMFRSAACNAACNCQAVVYLPELVILVADQYSESCYYNNEIRNIITKTNSLINNFQDEICLIEQAIKCIKGFSILSDQTCDLWLASLRSMQKDFNEHLSCKHLDYSLLKELQALKDKLDDIRSQHQSFVASLNNLKKELIILVDNIKTCWETATFSIGKYRQVLLSLVLQEVPIVEEEQKEIIIKEADIEVFREEFIRSLGHIKSGLVAIEVTSLIFPTFNYTKGSVSHTSDHHEAASPTADLEESASLTSDHHGAASPTADLEVSASPTSDHHGAASLTADLEESAPPTADHHGAASPTADLEESAPPTADHHGAASLTADLEVSASPTADLEESASLTADLEVSAPPTSDHHGAASLTSDHHGAASPTADLEVSASPTADHHGAASLTADLEESAPPTADLEVSASPTSDHQRTLFPEPNLQELLLIVSNYLQELVPPISIYLKESADTAEAENEESADITKAENEESADITKAENEESADTAEAENEESADITKAENEESADITKAENEESADITKAENEESADTTEVEAKKRYMKLTFLLLVISIAVILASLTVGILGFFVKKNLAMIIAGFSVLGSAVIATFILIACCIVICIRIYKIKNQHIVLLIEETQQETQQEIQQETQQETALEQESPDTSDPQTRYQDEHTEEQVTEDRPHSNISQILNYTASGNDFTTSSEQSQSLSVDG